jgi:cation diffusion facilitator CzcD-associated flavoprotein CzcO
MMPAWDDRTHGYPPRDHVVDYLTRYEDRYGLAVSRPTRVTAVTRSETGDDRLLVTSTTGRHRARAVVSATGTWGRPFWPAYPGAAEFTGRQLHAAEYSSPAAFTGQRVVVVGGGNSAAQILAEVSEVADVVWVTPRRPRFLPDDVDGRALFAAATARVRALREGNDAPGVGGLGDIVMVPAVRAARDRGVLEAQPMFTRLTGTGVAWADGSHGRADAILWCTGFRPDLAHLGPLRLRTRQGRIETGGRAGTRAVDEPRLFLVGYGDWTGPASATLIGVGRTARDTALEVHDLLVRG